LKTVFDRFGSFLAFLVPDFLEGTIEKTIVRIFLKKGYNVISTTHFFKRYDGKKLDNQITRIVFKK